MKKIKIAIVGYGNIGRAVHSAVDASPDQEVVGVVLRDSTTARAKGIAGIAVAEDITALGPVDVAILCAPSREVPNVAANILAQGINIVDSYDVHADIYDVQQRLHVIAREKHAVSVMATGLDPGIDSMIRGIFEAVTPRGLTYTNFGPGMSMGHTTVVKNIAGVKNALSMTIPLGTGLHRRMVYVEIADGSKEEIIREAILNDPYFINDETHVLFVDDVDARIDMGHAMHVERKGASGPAENQLLTFNMRVNNPAATAQMMVASARASMRLAEGCYTVLEIPIIDFLPGGRERIIRQLPV